MANILLIDDEAGSRSVIRQLLETADHDVTEAENADQGFALYGTGHYDLVITDLIMPGKSGTELILRIKGADPAAKVIAISGGGIEKDLNQLLEAGELGADHILSKPVLSEQLFEFVDDCLED